ncbi:MAG: hypothetical protein ACFFD1_07635 [Candidatus Thorarchaeota archaeon]
MITCGYCGEENDSDKQYCNKCGKIINIVVKPSLPEIADIKIYILMIVISYIIFISYMIFRSEDLLLAGSLSIIFSISSGLIISFLLFNYAKKKKAFSIGNFYLNLTEILIFLSISYICFEGIYILLEIFILDNYPVYLGLFTLFYSLIFPISLYLSLKAFITYLKF